MVNVIHGGLKDQPCGPWELPIPRISILAWTSVAMELSIVLCSTSRVSSNSPLNSALLSGSNTNTEAEAEIAGFGGIDCIRRGQIWEILTHREFPVAVEVLTLTRIMLDCRSKTSA